MQPTLNINIPTLGGTGISFYVCSKLMNPLIIEFFLSKSVWIIVLLDFLALYYS